MRTRRLIVVTPEGERELLFIGRLMVGRAPECDISLADTKVSRRHAELDASGPTPRVTDLGSRNGILVNGRKVGAADLAPGDVITAGDARIRFEERADTSETVEPAPAPTSDDRTAVIMPPSVRPPVELSASAPVRGPSLDPDKTNVMPPPPGPAPVPPVVPPPAPPAAAQAPPGDEPEAHTLMLAPPQRGPAPPAVPPPTQPGARAARPGAEGVATGRAAQGPQFSWGVLVTLAVMTLGGLAVLLGALLGPYAALVVTLGLALLTALLITRQTSARLEHFTHQVELVVSGASPNVMQGGLMPGLDRLPGVVATLIERRTGRASGYRAGPSMLYETDDPDLGPPAMPIDPGPPWLEVTAALLIAESSTHGPDAGASTWASANGRHLLDVLENGPIRNAVVQGLGALGVQDGAETTVPLGDGPPVVLRRGASGRVRVTLGAR